MADRALEITLRCATDLKKVNLVSKMDVYAVVSISGGDDGNSSKKIRTPSDRGGGSNPTWNFPIRLAVEEAALLQNRLTLDFKLVCERTLGDKDVGKVHVPVKELLDYPAANGRRFVSYQVTKPSGRPKGQLTFSYKFIGCNYKPTFSAPPAREAEFKSVYPPAAKAFKKPTVKYPVVEMDLESKSVYQPSNPAIEAAEGIEAHYLPLEYPPPSGYWYPPPESPKPNYWYPPPPGNVYLSPEYVYPPPIPKAARVNNIGSFSHLFTNL